MLMKKYAFNTWDKKETWGHMKDGRKKQKYRQVIKDNIQET